MPKLLQISIEVNSGSVGRIADQIGQTVMAHGWESFITFSRNNLPSQSSVIKIGNRWDMYWHGLMTRIFDTHCFWSKRASRQLIERIKAINPDVILLHHIHGYFLNMNILFEYLSECNKPIVWVFHDCWAFTGHCAYFDFVGCEKWKTACFACPQKKKYPGSWLLDNSKNNYKVKQTIFTSVNNMVIVAVSQWLEGVVKQSFFKEKKIKFIPNSIDIDVFSPQNASESLRDKYKIKNKTILLGVASTWDARKGLSDFIGLQKIIDEDIQIVLVGLSRKQIRKLPKGIIGIERTESVQQLAQLYSLADVFINPSVEETFGLTTVEAMACGTPVVVYNATASPELVTPETGFIVDSGDVEEIWRKVKVIRDLGKGYFSQKCRDWAVQNYNKKEVINNYYLLFLDMLTNKE